MRKAFLGLFVFMLLIPIDAQEQNSTYKVYNIKPWIDVSITIVGGITNYYGLQVIHDKPKFESATVVNLDPKDVNWFDRSATKQDPDFAETAHIISNYGLNVSFGLPFFLLLDKKIRNDWYEIIILYLETHSVTGNIYSLGFAMNIDRKRPLVYNPDVALDKKLAYGNNNSFYSGHTASTAAACFFMAKVYVDYYPELESKKYLYYSLAAIPPAFVGFFRYKAGKHYPTDIITGLLIGGSVGILIPHLHKIKNKDLSIVPVTGQFTGLRMAYKF